MKKKTIRIEDEICDIADQITKRCKPVLENPSIGAKKFSMALYLLLHNYITGLSKEGDFETSRLFSRAMIKTQSEVMLALCEQMNRKGANIDGKKILKGLEELVYGINRFGE